MHNKHKSKPSRRGGARRQPIDRYIPDYQRSPYRIRNRSPIPPRSPELPIPRSSSSPHRSYTSEPNVHSQLLSNTPSVLDLSERENLSFTPSQQALSERVHPLSTPILGTASEKKRSCPQAREWSTPVISDLSERGNLSSTPGQQALSERIPLSSTPIRNITSEKEPREADPEQKEKKRKKNP
ncbi:uncharacterized protein I303_107710 [Kwoniella dejecticola CBS 10117]|uniref:Uncharacterized protein n=1 Tax=Kwoniella dejecticola CBS 10117 TaxID=1296121 RepID=A0A1A5ZVI2_9TREE|nr:uncharacterized protein I303_07717 [Kwoniella dejecticola CBS 10117]OBR81807.1 hypothetical protein I303_07717 [Kwoniella dejecticola CBS 10117]